MPVHAVPEQDGVPRSSARQRGWVSWLIFIVITSALAINVGTLLGERFTMSDAEWYLRIAMGQTANVQQPFIYRQLGPLVVHAISNLFHVSIYTAFTAEGVASILLLMAVIGLLLVGAGVDGLCLAFAGGLAVWASLFHDLVLPDLFSAALLGVFLLFLFRRQYLLSALMLLPLYVARESTAFVLVCFLIVGYRRMRYRDLIVATVSALGGMRIVKALAAAGSYNQERVSGTVYMAGKIAWNFSKNFLGLPLWSNTNPNCTVPQWQLPVHIGGVHSLGVCAFDPRFPLSTARLMLGCFGLLPLILFYIWRRKPGALWPESVAVRFCVLYGVLSFVLAPTLGSGVLRLLGYAWPVFAVAVPILMTQCLRLPRGAMVVLLALHLELSWYSLLRGHDRLANVPQECVALLLILVAYAVGWMLLKRDGVVEEQTAQG